MKHKFPRPRLSAVLSGAPFYALACAAAGMMTTLALAPFDLTLFLFAGLSLFYILYTRERSGGRVRSFMCGFFFTLGYHLAGLAWIGNALLVEGNPYRWAWPLAVLGLPVLLALFGGAATLAARLATSFFSPTSAARGLPPFALFVLSIALAEWVRGHVLSGFPWNLYGYGWNGHLPVLQLLSLGGPYALTLLTVFWGAAPGFAWQSWRHRVAAGPVVPALVSALVPALALTLALFTLGAAWFWGHIRLDRHPVRFEDNIILHLVQPSIPQAEKWKPDKIAENFHNQIALSAPAPAEQGRDRTLLTHLTPLTHLIVWPETALSPVFLDSAAARGEIAHLLAQYRGNAHLLAGALRKSSAAGKTQFYNSIVHIGADGVYTPLYDKSHLVPFGEYLPAQTLIGAALPLKTVTGFQGFQRGSGPQTHFIGAPASGELAVTGEHPVTGSGTAVPPFQAAICYEIIFPGPIAGKREGAGGAGAPDHRPAWLLNVTNDAWYGISAGPYQHFAQAGYRAIETGIPVIRAANTGVSGVIGPLGRVVASTDIFEKARLQSALPAALPATALPPYQTYGDFLFFALCVLSGGLLFLPALRSAATKHNYENN